MTFGDPYTIRVFVAEGDPDGLRVIDRPNWTVVGVVIPRERWSVAREKRDELKRSGIYILSGYDEAEPDLVKIYIGQTEDLLKRLTQHDSFIDFWERVTIFTSNSTSNSLNRAHVSWLEWKLIQRAQDVGFAKLANSVVPRKPILNEFETADIEAFAKDIFRILPLVGMHVFEPKKIIKAAAAAAPAQARGVAAIDTIVVPAQSEGFNTVFLGENAWRAIRIAQSKRDKLKWIAVYQVTPISAITHIAEIDRIEPYGDTGKYMLVFKGPAQPLTNPVPYGDGTPLGVMQAPRYTSRERLLKAKSVLDINLT